MGIKARMKLKLNKYLMINIRHINSPFNDVFSLCQASSAIHPSFPMTKVTLLLSITIKILTRINTRKRNTQQRELGMMIWVYPSSRSSIGIGVGESWCSVSLEKEIVDGGITKVRSRRWWNEKGPRMVVGE